MSEPHRIGESIDPLADYRDRQRLAEMLSRLRKAVDEHGRCRANYRRVTADERRGWMYDRDETKARTEWAHAEQDLIRAAYAVFGWEYGQHG